MSDHKEEFEKTAYSQSGVDEFTVYNMMKDSVQEETRVVMEKEFERTGSCYLACLEGAIHSLVNEHRLDSSMRIIDNFGDMEHRKYPSHEALRDLAGFSPLDLLQSVRFLEERYTEDDDDGDEWAKKLLEAQNETNE